MDNESDDEFAVDGEIIRRWGPEETARRRAAVLHDQVLPVVRRAFADRAGIASAVMFVAQFWDDEAVDAVHCELVYAADPDPDVAALAADRDEEREREYQEWGEGWWRACAPDGWDSNDEAISLFAAFCSEVTSQEDEFADQYVPYAVFRRTADRGIGTEIVGQLHRPWLDGVLPEEADLDD